MLVIGLWYTIYEMKSFMYYMQFYQELFRWYWFLYAEKFSRHLIIRIPKTAFKDNLHAGAFVAEVCLTQQAYQTVFNSDCWRCVFLFAN